MKRKLFSVILLIAMMLSILSLPVSALDVQQNATYVAFTSDVHNKSGDVSSNRLNSWINAVAGKVGSTVDNFGICGDLGPASGSGFWDYAQKVINVITKSSNVEGDGFYVCGNHEYNPGSYTHNKNATTKEYSDAGTYLVDSDYILYSLGSRQWDEIYPDSDITAMEEFLEAHSDFGGPIFILAHFPLHRYKDGLSGEGSGVHDGKPAVGSAKIINVLNQYPNTVFLWGHNHSNNNDHYDVVYTDQINETPINFTYASAGCMSDSEYGASVNVKGKGLVAKIEEGALTLTYYDSNANEVGTGAVIALDNASTPAVTYTVQASAGENGTISPSGAVQVKEGKSATFTFTPNSGYEVDQVLVNGSAAAVSGGNYTLSNVTADSTIHVTYKPREIVTPDEPQTSNKILDLTPSTSTPKYSMTIAAGESFTARIKNASTNSGYDFTASFDKAGIAMVSGSNPVNISKNSTGEMVFTGVSAGTTTITLTNGNGSYARKATITLTVTGTAAPEQPQKPTVSALDVTPASSNPKYNMTIAVGDSLTAKIKNDSSYSTYTFSASFSTSGIAKVSGSPVKVSKRSTGEMTFVGVAPGSTTITISSGSGYSARKATINLTVIQNEPLVFHDVTASSDANGKITPSGAVSMEEGKDQAFTFIPNAGYELDQILVDGNPVAVSGSSYLMTDVMTDHTVSVSFKKIMYSVIAEAGEHGSISPSGSLSLEYGASQTFAFTAEEGYELASVLVNGKTVAVSDGSYTLPDIKANQTINVSFRRIQSTVTAVSGAGGSISPSGAVMVAYGESQTFTFAPNIGYELDQVLVNDVPVDVNNSYTFTDVREAQSISVTFKKLQFVVTASAAEHGSISPDGALNVAYGESRQFHFIPDAGYEVAQVLIDGSPVALGNSYTLSGAKADTSISVSFQKSRYQITASAGEGGTITPSGDIMLDYNESQTYEFAANEGHELDKLLVDGQSVDVSSSFTFSDISENHSIAVCFKKLQYTVTASAGVGGSISPSGAVDAVYDGSQAFAFTPNVGYELDQVLVDGEPVVVNGSSFVLTGIKADHTISADFKKILYTVSAEAGQGGSISPSGAITATYGISQTFSFTPEDGFVIDQVLVNGNPVAVSGNSYTLSNITEDTSVSVSFKNAPAKILELAPNTGNPNYSITIAVGESFTAKIKNESAYSAYDFTASFNKTGIVAVDGNPVNVAKGSTGEMTFTASSAGTATITLTNGNGSYARKATITLIVTGGTQADPTPATTLDVTPTTGNPKYSVTIFAGENFAVKIKNDSSNSSYNFTASFSTAGIASVNGSNPVNIAKRSTGEMTFIGIAPGTTTITITNGNGSYARKAAITLNVVRSGAPLYYDVTAESDSNGKITPSGKVSVEEGKSQTFTFTPNTGYVLDQVLVDGKAVTVNGSSYTVSDIRASKTIRVTFKKAEISVTGEKLSAENATLTVGNTMTLTATIAPSNATNQNVTWKSSNTSVATVSNGKITAIKAGTATITVTFADGSKTAKCVLTVKAKQNSFWNFWF